MALLALGGLQYALPSALSAGPDWLLLVVVAVLSIPLVLFHRQGRHRLNELVAYVILSIATAEMVASLGLLIARLPEHRESPKQLLLAASGLWISNIIVFASWYWRLDAGGPYKRD